MDAQKLKGNLEPMVMAVLEGCPSHGYAVLEVLREQSGGVFDLPEGTIYPALHRLEKSGAIKSDRETVEGRQRRVYRLTAKGKRELAASRASWTQFSVAVTRVLNVRPA